MKIIGISGSGIGAGKTSFARKMADEVWSLAGALRAELKKVCPEYDWFNRTQEYKNKRFKHAARVCNYLDIQHGDIDTMSTVRDALIVYGQYRCRDDEAYWVRVMCERLDQRLHIADGVKVIGIDDVRKLCEVQYLRDKYGEKFIHFHMDTKCATPEEVFENEQLAAIADYRVRWEK